MEKKIKQHKFIYFDKQTQKYRVRILQKRSDIKKVVFCKFLTTLEDAIKERDLFLSKYEDKRYKGVTYNKVNKNWNSFISFNGKSHYLATHDSQEEAKEYRNEILKKLMN